MFSQSLMSFEKTTPGLSHFLPVPAIYCAVAVIRSMRSGSLHVHQTYQNIQLLYMVPTANKEKYKQNKTWDKTRDICPPRQGFELVTLISIGVIYCPRPMHMWLSSQSANRWLIFIWNSFHTDCDSDLDLWPYDPNFDKVYLLPKANAHMKYQANRSTCWRVFDRKPTGLQTDRPTDIQQTNIPPLLQRGT